jgi:predicted transcriptional regulator
MKTQHKLLTVKEVVQILVDKEVISEKSSRSFTYSAVLDDRNPFSRGGCTDYAI